MGPLCVLALKPMVEGGQRRVHARLEEDGRILNVEKSKWTAGVLAHSAHVESSADDVATTNFLSCKNRREPPLASASSRQLLPARTRGIATSTFTMAARAMNGSHSEEPRVG